jgi:acetyl esterase/lipase
MVPGDGGRQFLKAPAGGNLVSDDPGSALTIWPLGWVAGAPAALVQLASSAEAPSDARSQYGAAAPRTLHLFSFPDGAPPVDLTAFFHQSVRRFVAGAQDDALVVADGALWSVSPRSPPRRISASDVRVVGLADAQGSFGGNEITALGGGRVGVRLRRDDGERLAILDLRSGQAVWTGPPGLQVAYTPDLTAVARVERQGWSSLLQVEGALTRQVAETNPEWRERPTGAVKRFTYTLDGRRLNGWIVLPPGYTSGALPAVVWIYGGQVLGEAPPPLALASVSLDLGNGQLWAGQGYAVIYPSTPIGHGADSDIPDSLARATVAAVDAAAASGWVDPARVGIMGHSFGGYSTAAVLSVRSDRFRAGIADSGAYDFAAGWGVRPQFQFLVDDTDHPFTFETRALTEEAQGGFFAPPWATPDAYRRTSPFDRAASIRSPLMLWVGDLDMGETSLGQSERMYAALRRTGNPTVLVRYWGQQHVKADPWALADQWRRAQAWFGAYVRDGHPRQAEMLGSVLEPSQRQPSN